MATLFGTQYGFSPLTPPPPPSLGQVLRPEQLQNVLPKLNTITVPEERRGLAGTVAAYEKIAPEYEGFANRSPAAGMGGGRQIEGYTLPTEQTLQGKPLVAKYDAQGNFKYLTMEGDNFLTPDVNQPNIIAQPRINAKGEMIETGVFDINQQDDGGFGSFLGDLVSDFGPMILAGLGANAIAGSGLLGAGAAAAGGTGLTLGGGGLGLTAGGTGLGLTAGSAGAGTIGGSLGSTLAGVTTGIGAGTALDAGLLSSGTGLTTGGSGLGLNTGGGLGLTTGSTGAGTIGAGLGETLAGINTGIGAGVTAGAAGGSVSPSMLQSIADKTGISVDTLKTFGPSVIQGLLGAGGSILTADKATDAARTQADAQIRAAQIAADAARFRPVGVTTRFGSSNFTTDAAGNVVTAGYTPSAEITGYQDRLRTLAGQGLTDVEGARTAYQPLTGAAQNLFSLGQSYLAKTPEQAAQEYIAKQTALLAPSRENQLAELRNRQFQTGRGGVAVSQGGNLMATSPELAAYYNSLAQSDLVLAAQADQEAQNRIKFGAGLFDTGANLQGRYYTGQTAAYSPFTTAMDTSSGLESLAQVPLTLSTQIGAKTTASAADVGRLTGQGIINAAGTMAPADAYSAAGNVLTGAAGSPVFASAVNKSFGNTQPTQQQYTFNPQTGQYVPVSQSVWI